MHITARLLAAVARGDLPPHALYEIVKAHVVALCETCEEGIAEYEASLLLEGADRPEAYGASIQRVRERVGPLSRKARREQAEAERWLRDLRRLPPEERRGKVSRAHKKYRGRAFIERVLAEAEEVAPRDPREALSLADAGLVACYEARHDEYDPNLMVRAVALRGNAHRVLGHLKAADADLRFARRVSEQEPVTDVLVGAQLDSYEGSLRKLQGRLKEAAPVLHRAATLYRVAGERERTARTLMKLSLVHLHGGSHDEGVEAAEKVLELLGDGVDETLHVRARHNLALLLHARGDYQRAEEILDEDPEAFSKVDEEFGGFQVPWLRARIAWSREELARAEELFLETLRKARERGVAYDVALVALQLALVYLAEDRWDEVENLATEAIDVFRREEVHPEVFTGLSLIHEAARRRQATREMIQKTVAFLDRERAGLRRDRAVAS